MPSEPQGQEIPLSILYEDAQIIVIDKPAGLVVHPAAGHADGTLVNALIAHCGESLSGIGGVKRPGIVHRLDKDTSGVMVVAKTDKAHRGLAEQFADHGREGPLEREYQAFVWGRPRADAMIVDRPIGRSTRHRERMAVVAEGRGKEALTHLYVEEIFPPDIPDPLASRIRCRLETGRTHQIRVHLSSLGHPLLGDPVYGGGFRTKINKLDEPSRAALRGARSPGVARLRSRFRPSGNGEEASFRERVTACSCGGGKGAARPLYRLRIGVWRDGMSIFATIFRYIL